MLASSFNTMILSLAMVWELVSRFKMPVNKYSKVLWYGFSFGIPCKSIDGYF